MAQVDICVNDRVYKVTCDNGQEQRLQQLAGYFDRHVSRLSDDLGQIGDARLMLLSALTVCDELFEARTRCSEMEKAAKALDSETASGASSVIEAAARRVTAITERLSEG
ncbi:MAG: cell division protein ZapA [Parvularculaceae bacterium]